MHSGRKQVPWLKKSSGGSYYAVHEDYIDVQGVIGKNGHKVAIFRASPKLN